MKSKNRIFFMCLLALLIASLACEQSAFRPTATQLPPTATATLIPATHTPIPPTATATLTATSTPVPPTPTPILPTPDIAFRRISLNELKGNSLVFEFPIEFDIPKEYTSINNEYTDYTGYIWTLKKYAGGFQGMPMSVDADYLDVNTSTSIGYDGATNAFIGAPYTDQEKKDFEEAVKGVITFWEQRNVGEFPILIMEVSNLPPDVYSGFTKFNIMYIGTTVGTMTLTIKTLSSPENFIRNEYIWARLKSSISIKK